MECAHVLCPLCTGRTEGSTTCSGVYDGSSDIRSLRIHRMGSWLRWYIEGGEIEDGQIVDR